MELTLATRDLLLVSWEVDPGTAARPLPEGLEPQLTESGRGLLSLAAFRNEALRLDGRRVPSFSQLNVRTYVTRGDEAAILILSMRVTLAGLGGALFGAPYRPARLRVRPGNVQASGLGVSFRYRAGGPAPAVPTFPSGQIGTEEVAYFVAAGLRRVPAQHEPHAWREAELAGESRFEPMLALGFDLGAPDSVLYAERTAFRLTLPPEKVA